MRKDCLVIFRINAKQQFSLHKTCSLRGLSVSELLREALDSYSKLGKIKDWQVSEDKSSRPFQKPS